MTDLNNRYFESYFEWLRAHDTLAPDNATGQWTAYRAWRHSVDADTQVLVAEDGMFANADRWAAFIAVLEGAGLTEFVITNTSTDLMASLHVLGELGCQVAGLATVEVHSEWDGVTLEQGLRILL